MKQSAVSWLIQNIVEDQTIKAKPMSEWLEIFEQAKSMEREQIIQARLSLDQTDNIWDKEIFSNMAEQYYNETYKQHENE
jgi:hypothetical protein